MKFYQTKLNNEFHPVVCERWLSTKAFGNICGVLPCRQCGIRPYKMGENISVSTLICIKSGTFIPLFKETEINIDL